jgi:hypothetical protein
MPFLTAIAFPSRNIGIGLCACIVLGCGTTETYSNSSASDSSVAIIRAASRATVLFSPRPVVIEEVDGKRIPGTSSSIKVSPGGHVLRVTCRESLFAKNTHDLSIYVQAGETYSLSAHVEPDKIRDGTEKCKAELTRDVSN